MKLLLEQKETHWELESIEVVELSVIKEEDEEEIADESDSENKVESEERENKDKEVNIQGDFP